MEHIILYFIGIFGLTYLGVAASITWRPRHYLYKRLGPLKGVLACAPCFSFWVGAVLGYPLELSLDQYHPIAVYILDHTSGAILAMGFVSLIQWLVGSPIAELR